jgi:hypothetical protein
MGQFVRNVFESRKFADLVEAGELAHHEVHVSQGCDVG